MAEAEAEATHEAVCADALPTCEELDAELSRLLNLDADAEAGAPTTAPPRGAQATSVAALEALKALEAVEARVAALEHALDARLNQLQALAEAKIYAAAVDAAHAVRRILDASRDGDNQTTAEE